MSTAIAATAQCQTKAFSTCDTFTVKGYTICLTTYCKKTKKFDNYFGFCSNSELQKDTLLNKVVLKYKEEKINKRKSVPLINISKKDFGLVKSSIGTALFWDYFGDGYQIIGSICDTSVRNYMYKCIYPDSNSNPIRPPSATGYCFDQKIKINKRKPLISVEPMTLTCVELTYASFQSYYETNLKPEFFSHPLSFCASYYQNEIEIKEIRKATKSDGKYHLLIPVYRID